MNHFSFPVAKQAVVHEDARQLVTDGLVDERGSNAGIHTTTETQDDLFLADLGPDFIASLFDVVAHGPAGPAATDAAHEVGQDLLASG